MVRAMVAWVAWAVWAAWECNDRAWGSADLIRAFLRQDVRPAVDAVSSVFLVVTVRQRVSAGYEAEAETSDSTSARCRIQKSLDIANGLPSVRASAADSHGRIVLCTHRT